MKKTLIILCIFITGFFQAAMAVTTKEIIYLKNGSVIKCNVIEIIPKRSIKIETDDGSVFVYKISEVEKITDNRRGRSSGKVIHIVENQKQFISKGYRGMFDMGYTFGTGYNPYNRFCISMSHGYQFNPYLFLGVGVGLDLYDNDFNSDNENLAVPVFTHFRYDILNRKVSPFMDFKLGYSFEDYEGVYISTSAGVRFIVGNNFGINFSVGYTVQDLKNSWSDYGYGADHFDFRECNLLDGVSLRIGISF